MNERILPNNSFFGIKDVHIIPIFLFCMINTVSLCKTKPNTDNDILRTKCIEKFIIYNFLMFNLSDFHCFKINPFSYPKIQKWRTQTLKRNKIPSNHATFFLTTGSTTVPSSSRRTYRDLTNFDVKNHNKKITIFGRKNTIFSSNGSIEVFFWKLIIRLQTNFISSTNEWPSFWFRKP